MQTFLFKNIFGCYFFFICKPIFKIIAAYFRTKGLLNNDKTIFVWRCLKAWWYAKYLLLKDVAYGLVSPTSKCCAISYNAIHMFKSSKINCFCRLAGKTTLWLKCQLKCQYNNRWWISCLLCHNCLISSHKTYFNPSIMKCHHIWIFLLLSQIFFTILFYLSCDETIKKPSKQQQQKINKQKTKKQKQKKTKTITTKNNNKQTNKKQQKQQQKNNNKKQTNTPPHKKNKKNKQKQKSKTTTTKTNKQNKTKNKQKKNKNKTTTTTNKQTNKQDTIFQSESHVVLCALIYLET